MSPENIGPPQSVQDRPDGPYQPTRVRMQFVIRTEIVKNISELVLMRAVSKAASRVKQAISFSVRRSYEAGGLRILTGDLFRMATKNFIVKVMYFSNGGTVDIQADWTDRGRARPYFYRRLYGYVGPDSLRRTFGSGFDTPKNNYFILLDDRAQQDIRRIIEAAVDAAVLKAVAEVKKARPATAEVQQMTGGKKLTQHRMRRTIAQQPGVQWTSVPKMQKQIMSAIQREGLTFEETLQAIAIGAKAVKAARRPVYSV